MFYRLRIISFVETVEEQANHRLEWDEDVVDVSNRMFQLTTMLAIWSQQKQKDQMNLTIFPGRRWVNFRNGDEFTEIPDQEKPLIYIGNPIGVTVEVSGGIQVFYDRNEFTIRTGMELGY